MSVRRHFNYGHHHHPHPHPASAAGHHMHHHHLNPHLPVGRAASWYAFSHQHLPGLGVNSGPMSLAKIGPDARYSSSAVLMQQQDAGPTSMGARSPPATTSNNNMFAASTGFLAYPVEYEPFPHAMTEWRDR